MFDNLILQQKEKKELKWHNIILLDKRDTLQLMINCNIQYVIKIHNILQNVQNHNNLILCSLFTTSW